LERAFVIWAVMTCFDFSSFLAMKGDKKIKKTPERLKD